MIDLTLDLVARFDSRAEQRRKEKQGSLDLDASLSLLSSNATAKAAISFIMGSERVIKSTLVRRREGKS